MPKVKGSRVMPRGLSRVMTRVTVYAKRYNYINVDIVDGVDVDGVDIVDDVDSNDDVDSY